MRITFAVLAALLVMQQVACQTLTYQHNQELIPGVYTLFWTADENTQTMYFATKVKTTGWSGFGISVSGGMVGSDVVIGWIDNTNTAIFDDRRVFEKGPIPTLDASQDWTLTHSQKTGDGFVILEFNRQFATGDKTGDVDITAGPTKVVYAYSNALPASKSDIQYHTERGATQISFFGAPVVTPDLNGTVTFDLVVAPNTVIPSASTTYWCKKVEFPQVDAHIIRYEPIIVNLEKVHHMVLYNCPAGFEPSVDSGNCDKLPEFGKCQEISYVWARGGLAFDLPPVAGTPIGPGFSRFAYLEMHYDNPNQQSGDKDSSGIKIFYTTQKRQFDAGVLTFGRDPGAISVPPGQKSFDLVGTCPSGCTNAGLPKQGIKAYGVLLHAHLLGRSVRTDVFRKGVQQQPVGALEYYDFNFQTFLPMEPHYSILPGDELVTHCIYDSTGKSTVTKGGESTENEMCYNFVFYYPRLEGVVGCSEGVNGACPSGGLPIGPIAGIVVGGVVVLAAIGGIIGFVVYRRRKALKRQAVP